MNTDTFEDKLIIITDLSYFDRIKTGKLKFITLFLPVISSLIKE